LDYLILLKKKLYARIIISFNIGILYLKILSDTDSYIEKIVFNERQLIKSIKFPFYNKNYLSELKIKQLNVYNKI
jgi:hypothetical protein